MEKAKIHYEVNARFWHKEVGHTLQQRLNAESTCIHREFKDLFSARQARLKAFKYYQNIIDVLYDGLGKPYVDDANARIDLQKYIDSGNGYELCSKRPDLKFKMGMDYDNSIEVVMVIDEPLPNSSLKVGTKLPLHGIYCIDYIDRPEDNMLYCLENLLLEYEYYEQNDYYTTSMLTSTDFTPIGGDEVHYLSTPFNWEQFVKQFKGLQLVD